MSQLDSSLAELGKAMARESVPKPKKRRARASTDAERKASRRHDRLASSAAPGLLYQAVLTAAPGYKFAMGGRVLKSSPFATRLEADHFIQASTVPLASAFIERVKAPARATSEAKRLSRAHPIKLPPRTADDVEVRVWEERDRLAISAYDKRNAKEIASWFDDDARDMFESGYFKSGPKLKRSVAEYVIEMGLR
jgi:hypothetical protein